MKAILGLFRPVPKTKDSHNAAYANIWADILRAECLYLKDDYQDVDELFLYIDINYKGSVNLFDGLSEDIYNRMNNLIKFSEQNKKITILDHEIPNLKEIFISRFNNESTFEKITKEWIERLHISTKDICTIKMTDFVKDEIVIGDSHSLSIAPKGVAVIRLDAKTLHGALKGDFINNLIPERVKKVTLMFGSIDIRHHLLRFDEPYEAADKLLKKYKEKIKELSKLYQIEIHTPVPVEYEERKMASTSQYKKTNFYGSIKERQDLTKYFIQEMNKFSSDCRVLNYPTWWYELDPKIYAEKIMERPRGLHVGYTHYRLNNYGEIVIDEW